MRGIILESNSIAVAAASELAIKYGYFLPTIDGDKWYFGDALLVEDNVIYFREKGGDKIYIKVLKQEMAYEYYELGSSCCLYERLFELYSAKTGVGTERAEVLIKCSIQYTTYSMWVDATKEASELEAIALKMLQCTGADEYEISSVLNMPYSHYNLYQNFGVVNKIAKLVTEYGSSAYTYISNYIGNEDLIRTEIRAREFEIASLTYKQLEKRYKKYVRQFSERLY